MSEVFPSLRYKAVVWFSAPNIGPTVVEERYFRWKWAANIFKHDRSNWYNWRQTWVTIIDRRQEPSHDRP